LHPYLLFETLGVPKPHFHVPSIKVQPKKQKPKQTTVLKLFCSFNHRVLVPSLLKYSIDIQVRVDPHDMSDLIVDFPDQRKHRAVQFAGKAQLYTVERHENTVARHELWYTKDKYCSMKLDIREDVLRARSMQSLPFNYSGYDDDDDDDSPEESSGFWIGIAHLLTPACMLGVRTCRARCVYAVLVKQASLSPSARFRWEDIALASLAQTRKAVLRARELGKLHRKSL
jgi:hypothetical protein